MKQCALRFLVLVVLIALLFACKQRNPIHLQSQDSAIVSEIELLSGIGNELPEVVSEEDIQNCTQAIDLAQTLTYKTLELDCLIRLFQLQNKKEVFRDALQTGNQALSLAESMKGQKALAEIYKLFGKNYYHISSFHKAFKNLETSLSLYRELKDTLNQQDVLNMQGNIYFSWEDFDMAFKYYSQTFELGKSRNDNAGIAKALTNMGIVYAARSGEQAASSDSILHIREQAIQYISNALHFIEKTDEKVMRAEILNNLAIIYRIAGDYQKSLETLELARKLVHGVSDRVYTSTSLTYASTLRSMDSIMEAKEILLNTLGLAREKELNVQIINILSMLGEISEENKDFESAYIYQKEHSKLSDSIFNLDYKKKIDAIKMASEIETVIQQQKLRQQQVFYQTLIIVASLVFVLSFVLLLYSRLRVRNKNIQLENNLLNERLETRNKELTTRIMALIQRNELEKEIVQKLNLLRPKMKKENQSDISEIISSLSFKQSDQLWKEFEIRFENVHQEFFNKLTLAYPDLTPNEKRLCAFLYLDMSSKDISSITGQSVRALNVARTRLRKKFNLTSEAQSLSGFLNSIS